ncbi:MAG: porin family protein [Bacteroidales bacterium]
MNKTGRLIFLLLMASTVIYSNAQVKLGVNAGLNFTNMVAKDDSSRYDDDFQLKPGIHIGGTAEFTVIENFSIVGGIFLSTMGYKSKSESTTVKMNVNYLAFPLYAKYRFKVKDFFILANAGPYLSFGLNGTYKSNENIFRDKEGNQVNKIPINIGRYETDELKQVDYGVNIGTGIEYESFVFEIHYGLGLANLATITDNNFMMKNRSLEISAGYKFGISPEQSRKSKTRGRIR